MYVRDQESHNFEKVIISSLSSEKLLIKYNSYVSVKGMEDYTECYLHNSIDWEP